jgi:hypothetical protein
MLIKFELSLGISPPSCIPPDDIFEALEEGLVEAESENCAL